MLLTNIMDKIDKKILNILQKNAAIPLSELSSRVGISSTPCWHRIKKMEEEGTIISKIAVLDNEKVNLPITIFLSISISHHSKDWLENFTNIVNKYDQIIEVYRTTGTASDYLLKIVAPSINDYDKFQQKLINEIEFSSMTSSVSLSRIKKINFLPLDFI